MRRGTDDTDSQHWLPLISRGFQKVAVISHKMENNVIQKPGGLDSVLLARHLAYRQGEAKSVLSTRMTQAIDPAPIL
jgi:hypothetical protein